MPHAIVMHTPGNHAVLQWVPIAPSAPLQPHEVRLRHTAIGVNYHDVYVRSGLYQTLKLPGIPGIEAVGVVQEVGSAVTHLNVGQRVAYITRQYGAYAQERTIAADFLAPIPDGINNRVAASAFLKGLTAQVLVRTVYAVQPRDWVLVHSAAGGVGTLLCQWASQLGAQVIGTVGSPEKILLAQAAGCTHVINYREENFVARVKAITAGAGVQVAYDSVGKDTFLGSLECLASCGHLANFGQSSGPIAPIDISQLFAKSNVLSRASVFQHLRTPALLQSAASSLFAAIQDGTLRIAPSLQFDLRDAAKAHEALESRERTQSILLIP